MAQAQAGRMQQVIGDIGKWFKSPEELTPIPGQERSQDIQQQQGQNRQNQGQGRPQNNQNFGGNNGPQGSTNAGASNDPETMENPLDVYAGLFSDEPRKDKEGNPIKPAEPPKFALDPKTITDAATKIDFMSGLPEEVSTKLQSGNIDAETLSAVVQHAGRNAYARAMEHASALTDRYVGMRLSHEQQGLPGQLHGLLAKHQAINNPAIRNNPVLKEHYELVSERLAKKFPDQPPEWIASQANQYFTDMAKAVNPKLGTQDSDPVDGTNAKGETVKDGKVFDWQGYLKT